MTAELRAFAGVSLQRRRETRGRAVIAACALFAGVAAVLGLTLGPMAIGGGDMAIVLLDRIGLWFGAAADPVHSAVIESIRAPRVALGLAAGAALGIAGAVMQGIFRNPLADPGLIGVSSGGAAAAVAVIVLGAGVAAPLIALLGPFALPVAAFTGSLTAVALIYRVSLFEGRVVVATMLLAGVAANALAAALIGYLTFLADDAQLRTLTFWTLGSLNGATWSRVWPALILMGIAIAALSTLARPLNSLLLGESEAKHLGTDVEALKLRAAVCTAAGVGAATAVCGIIGFVGLVTPHLVRLMTGPDHRFVLPGSALLGAGLLTFADLVARLAVQPAELPLGVVTAFIGAPFFFWLLIRDKTKGTLA